ncbi:hypothetical protein [Gimesia aquarii]|uniref:Glycosyltransferase RgtA/B/C/D-like domain-containing protein n=1 Tax=Gimesia aquarii TaxID=2527964 RepID=A0A517WX23_9PLAN|nr:hypothetical protein [Gimesia aquarii]QDU09752.1 hypothetical protein V202x_31440 [Gimesia aquarii]
MPPQSTNHLVKLLFLGVLSTYLLLIIFGVKEFQIWPQIEFLRNQGVELNFTTIYFHPHGMRFLLVSPIYPIANLLHADPNKIFSLSVVMMCVIISITLANAIALFQKVKDIWVIKLMIFLFIALLSLFMNGRLIFGFCAYSLIIYSVFLWEKKSDYKKSLISLSLISLALFLSSISSGIAISFYFLAASLMLVFLKHAFKKRTTVYTFFAIYVLTLFLCYTPIICSLIHKNILFFGEGGTGILAMTQHGTLSWLRDFLELFINHMPLPPAEPEIEKHLLLKILHVGFVVLLASFIYIYRGQFSHNPQLLFTTYCMTLILLLSSFAYSILMMAFIPAIIMLAILSSQFRSTRRHFFDGYQATALNKT